MSTSDLAALTRIKQAGLEVKAFGAIGPYAYGFAIWNPRVEELPTARLYPRDGHWIFEVWEYIPGPGPGDFQQQFVTLDDAIAAVLDYYDEDYNRMGLPQEPSES